MWLMSTFAIVLIVALATCADDSVEPDGEAPAYRSTDPKKLEFCPHDTTNQGRDPVTLQCTAACTSSQEAARAIGQTGQTCNECISNSGRFATVRCKAVSSEGLDSADSGDTCDQWCCCGGHGYFMDEAHGGSAGQAHLVRCYPTHLKASCSDKSGDGDISNDPVTDADCGHLDKWHDPHVLHHGSKHGSKHGSHHHSHHGHDGWHGKHGWHKWEEDDWQTGHLDWVALNDMGDDHGSHHGSHHGYHSGKNGYHDYAHGKHKGKHRHHHHHWHYHAKPHNSEALWIPAVEVTSVMTKQGYYEDSPFCDNPEGCDTSYNTGIDWLKCCELRAHEEDEDGKVEEDLVYTPTVDPNQCSCRGIPEEAEEAPADDQVAAVDAKVGKKFKGKASRLADGDLEYNSRSRVFGVTVAGVVAMVGLVVAAIVAVAFFQKAQANIGNLVQEVQLREEEIAVFRQRLGDVDAPDVVNEPNTVKECAVALAKFNTQAEVFGKIAAFDDFQVDHTNWGIKLLHKLGLVSWSTLNVSTEERHQATYQRVDI